MSEQAAWDDPDLTEKVAWAMGVEAAGKHADANGGQVDREPTKVDWYNWKHKRKCAGITERWSRPFNLYQAFRNGWQAQRAELLAEHVVKILHGAMAYYCIDDGKIEDVIEWFTKRVKLDGWFIGADE